VAPDLNALLVFGYVAESRSFSEAARRLDMPKSTVSRQVAELERALNATLLERSTRGLKLTAVGTDVFEKARRSIELSEAVTDIANEHQAIVSGILRISAPPSISDSLLVPIVDAFQEAHPRVRVQIIITDRFVNMMADGVDVSFIVGPLNDTAAVPRTILTYRHRVVASPWYLDRFPEPLVPDDLRSHSLYAFSFWTPDNTWVFSRTGHDSTSSITFKPRLSINDYLGMVPALLAGRGIGELPPLVRPDLLRDGHLVEVLPQWHLPTFNLKVVHLANRYVSRAVAAFLEYAVERAPLLFPELPT
jgi:DNA-binding transcriptional LysR family regulator